MGNPARNRKTREQFIEEARSVHGDLFGYSLVEYENTHKKVKIICFIHGVFEQSPNKHLIGRGCPKCTPTKKKQIFLQRYGVEHPAQNKDVQEKTKQTNLERYGVEYPFQSKTIQDKIKQTNIEKYGVENPFANNFIQKRIRQTNIEKYGTTAPLQNKDIQAKLKQTNLTKYGVENPSQNKQVQEKRKQTNMERYGVESPFAAKGTQDKIKQTNLEKYGIENGSQKHYSKDTISKLNSFEYLYEEYIDKNKTSYQIAQELNVDPTTICNYLRLHSIPTFKIAAFSKSCIQWLNSIIDKEGIYIQHAGNIGEFNIPGTRLLVDGYCKDNNTIYEFYGDCFHGNLDVYGEKDYPHPFNPNITTIELYNRTMEREEKIKELGYNIESIWEKEYRPE